MNEPNERLESTAEWLSSANDEILTVELLREKGQQLTSQICFHSQLAAEKAIKAGLTFLNVEFPLIHNLVKLSNLLPPDWDSLPETEALTVLSEWAVKGRYTRTTTRPSIGQSEEAYRQAKAVIEAITKELNDRKFSL
ncbi:MAG: HEPN domain-containing protein [Cyanobacteria bacterium P01_D01_bin.1]